MKTVYDDSELIERDYREDCFARKVAKQVVNELVSAEHRGAQLERERIRLEIYKQMSKGHQYPMYLFEIMKIIDNK